MSRTSNPNIEPNTTLEFLINELSSKAIAANPKKVTTTDKKMYGRRFRYDAGLSTTYDATRLTVITTRENMQHIITFSKTLPA